MRRHTSADLLGQLHAPQAAPVQRVTADDLRIVIDKDERARQVPRLLLEDVTAQPVVEFSGRRVAWRRRSNVTSVPDFSEQDLTGARFDRVSLRGATFNRVGLNDARLRSVDFSGAQFRGALFAQARLLGVELIDVEIYGELQNVVVNGVDIAPLVEAELNRRMPERARMRPDGADAFREAWRILERLWDGTVAHARALPEDALHRSVDDEWSFIQTLRHLNFASAAWVGRMILGTASPWHELDLPWDEAPGWAGIPWERDASPSLDDVLTVRQERQAMVRGVMESLTDEQLASKVTCAEPGWPQIENFPVKQCLRIILNEEWEHRLYAERDLAALEKRL